MDTMYSILMALHMNFFMLVTSRNFSQRHFLPTPQQINKNSKHYLISLWKKQKSKKQQLYYTSLLMLLLHTHSFIKARLLQVTQCNFSTVHKLAYPSEDPYVVNFESHTINILLWVGCLNSFSLNCSQRYKVNVKNNISY